MLSYCMINQAVADEFVLVDVNEQKLKGSNGFKSMAVHSPQLH